ncbi:MAG: hypothetical protein AAF597_15055, partial [Bacteroidota bacterium]
MSTDQERGSLGERFHDLPTPANQPGLSWEQMAPQVLQPQKVEREGKTRPIIWWSGGVALLLLLAGLGYPLLSDDTANDVVAEKLEQPTDTTPPPAATNPATAPHTPITDNYLSVTPVNKHQKNATVDHRRVTPHALVLGDGKSALNHATSEIEPAQISPTTPAGSTQKVSQRLGNGSVSQIPTPMLAG